LSEQHAVDLVLAVPKVESWLARYPPRPRTEATFESRSGRWRVQVWSGAAGEIARGFVDDKSGRVLDAWTGPQVRWSMARGEPGTFVGTVLLAWPVWLVLSALFLLGLGDVRRPLSLRNLDLLVLLSFGVSLAFFNDGKVIQSAGLAALPLAYLLARCAWIGFRGAAVAAVTRPLPVWVLVVTTLFLLGFRVGLDTGGSSPVIDVGYAGVIGAHRILHGQAPYGHMPVENRTTPCGPADVNGRIRDWIQENGRCESSNASGDTYGPLNYVAYVPFVAAIGWDGRWDRLWAARGAAIAFDLLTVLGLAVAGLRLGGRRLAATLAYGWAAFPFTAYALNANTNDTLVAALLVWGFAFLATPFGRGLAVGAAGLAKFAAFLLTPLWLSYGGSRRGTARFGAGLGLAALAGLCVLLLEPSVGSAFVTFWEHTIEYQLERDSPFSPWDWGQYHAAGVPDLHLLQLVLGAGVMALAGAVVFLPREKGPLELAALTAAILLGLELVLTHWFYLYLPWVLPFVLLALQLPATRHERI
jgi:hypothetical protein